MADPQAHIDLDDLVARARSVQDDEGEDEILGAIIARGPEISRPVAERLLRMPAADDQAQGARLIALVPPYLDDGLIRAQGGGGGARNAEAFRPADRDQLAASVAAVLEVATDEALLEALVLAAGHLEVIALLIPVLGHAAHPDADVREAVAWALSKPDPVRHARPAVDALVRLARDGVDAVREWAMIGLADGGIDPIDTPETRELFREALEDRHDEVRREAAAALGVLGDVPALVIALRDPASADVVEAAERAADRRLVTPLEDLRAGGWTQASEPQEAADRETLLARALRACSGDAKPRRSRATSSGSHGEKEVTEPLKRAALDRLLQRAREVQDDDVVEDEVLDEIIACGPEVSRQVSERLLMSDAPGDQRQGAYLICLVPRYIDDEELRAYGKYGVGARNAEAFDAAGRERLAVFVARLLETADDDELVNVLVHAAAHLEVADLVTPVLRHAEHEDPDIREAVAWTLPHLDPPRRTQPVVDALLRLARDPSDAVRNWATSALGGATDPVDTPEARNLYRENLEDPYDEVRKEAAAALGLLGDVPALAIALSNDFVPSDLIEAAERAADQRLVKPLLDLRARGWALYPSNPTLTADLEALMASALRACGGAV